MNTDRPSHQARIVRCTSPVDFEPVALSVRQGGVIGFPTDTVYGIGASPEHEAALKRIYRIKGRAYCKPLPVLVASKMDAVRIAQKVPHTFGSLVERFWPGALTLIVEVRPSVSPVITAGGRTVGIRMPAHAIARELIAACGGALATTSANPSGAPEARTVDELMATIGAELDWVVDGGDCGHQLPSTVLDLTTTPFTIRREGPIARCQIEDIAGAVVGSD